MSNIFKVFAAVFSLILLGISIPNAAADVSLKQKVVWEIQNYYPDNSFDIRVEQPGRVIIKGDVRSCWDRRNVFNIVSRIHGVINIIDELAVNTEIIPNEIIKANFERDLSYNRAIIEPEKIEVTVENGLLLLQGTVSFQREANIAEDIASWQKGVMSVRNELSVLPPNVAFSDQNLERIITNMIARDFPMLFGIQAKVDAGHVTLTGTVPRLNDAYWLNKEVSRIYGVVAVKNDVVVGGKMTASK
jgi:hypothetical protein